MKGTVSIATRPLVYQVFRHVENKVHYALAEYIDNSISSYNGHREILSKLNPNGKVTVDIDIQEDCIRISDDAFGIEKANYQRAFELAQIPLDTKGLNEFGMGMKVSSIWLSNHWVVESTAFGENTRKRFEFDLEDVIREEKTDLEIEEEPAALNEHYTSITLTQLSNNKPTTRQIANIKKHLCSIYSQFIKNGTLELRINGEVQEHKEPKILNAPYYKNQGGESIEWRYDFNYDFGLQKAKGFIAILEKQSNAEQNGFLLFRRGRTIGTSSDERYRPKALCGSVGSPQYKRIFGEIEVEGFEVSFTKSSFTEDDQFQSFIEELSREIKVAYKHDIFGQAEHYRKTEDPSVTEKKAVDTISKKFVQPIKIVTSPNVPDKNDAQALPKRDSQEPAPPQNSKLLQKPITNLMTIDDKVYSVEIRFIKQSGGQAFYSIETGNTQGSFVVNLFMDNPYFSCYNQLLKDEESASPMLHIIQALVATEIQMHSNGQATAAKTYRDILNSTIGKF